MTGRGIADAIFILRQLQKKKYLAKTENFYFAFVDLEKAFDRVPGDAIRWTLRRLGVEGQVVTFVQSMYRNAPSQVRMNDSFSDTFLFQIGLHLWF